MASDAKPHDVEKVLGFVSLVVMRLRFADPRTNAASVWSDKKSLPDRSGNGGMRFLLNRNRQPVAFVSNFKQGDQTFSDCLLFHHGIFS